MIKRINLIEKKPFTFTYQKLIQICLLVLLALALFVEGTVLKTKKLQKNVNALQTELAQLDTTRNELTKLPVQKTVTVGEYQEIFDVIQNTPHWSNVLADVGLQLPNTVWITQFESSSTLQSVSTPDPNKTGPDSVGPVITQKVAKNTLELSGVGSDMRSITEFTAKLSRVDYLKNVILSESTRQGYGFLFKMKGDIDSHVR